MGDADYVMRTNAVGTLNVNEVFYGTRRRGFRDRQRGIDGGPHAAGGADSDSAVPARVAGRRRLHERTCCRHATSFPRRRDPAIAYAVSKSFVRWYSTSQCERFNGRGLRIVSVSPGSIDTEMGRLEEQAGAGAMVTDAAVPRWGKPEEMAELFAFCASRQSRLSHRHRHPQRWRGGRLDEGASQGGRRKRLSRKDSLPRSAGKQPLRLWLAPAESKNAMTAKWLGLSSVRTSLPMVER